MKRYARAFPVAELGDGRSRTSASANVQLPRPEMQRCNDQVTCYDDGVDTSSFRPLAILGGAFGVGLRRNVISLYKFACCNFRTSPD